MKKVYFVRHGQSNANASIFRQQTGESVLTPRGVAQAKEVARHMKRLPLEAVISSTFNRAKATASEIGKGTGLPIDYSELFIERRRPGVQLRKRKPHPHWLWVQLQLALFGRFSKYRHSDEETPTELLQRAHAALAYLAVLPESNIAVVTHGTFMRAMYAAMTYGEGVTGRMYLRATRWMSVRNTALMIATYDGTKWEAKAWNADAREL
jgi:broad specificity phosphatase PhoE